jgi:hypothetical protein
MKNFKGKTVFDETRDPCPNPRCNKPRIRHTAQEAQECLRTATADL